MPFSIYLSKFVAMTREEINKDIDRYQLQAKKVKNIVPLITVIVAGTSAFFLKDFDKYPYLAVGGMGSILLYVSSFVYTYFKSTSKVKELEDKLNQLNN